MKYLEIIARQEALEGEMHGCQAALQDLQAKRIALAGTKEDLHTTTELSSGIVVDLDLQYEGGDTNIFTLTEDGTSTVFSVEDYNEMSQFFSRFNDAILAYMTEKTKVEEGEEA